MNLLIDGMPGCGKTTAISTALRSLGLLPYCAGFRTVRVYSASGEHLGFAQLPASQDAGTEAVSDEPLPHMIIECRKQPSPVRETFTGFTINSLRSIPEMSGSSPQRESGRNADNNAPDIRLILMDEIGGTELEIPEVREAFMDALKGPVPCIGVIKSDRHARKFAYESYRRFRSRIEKETDTEFLYMNAENRREVCDRIRLWLSGI